MLSKNEKNYGDAIEPIAIIGMSCRYPGQVSSPEEFWDMLSNGRSGHCAVPPSRFDASAFYHPDHDRKGAVSPTPQPRSSKKRKQETKRERREWKRNTEC
jgi:hypothetical protein